MNLNFSFFRLGLIPPCVRLGLYFSPFNPKIPSLTPIRLLEVFANLEEPEHSVESECQVWSATRICYGLEHYYLCGD